MQLSHSRVQIENAIVDALQPLMASLKVRTLKPYGGQLDNPEKIKEAVKQWPAILVSYQNASKTDEGQRKILNMRYAVLAGDYNVDLAQARRGGSANPGALNILEGLVGLLEGEQLFEDIFATEADGDASVIQFAGLSLYVQRLVVKQPYLVPLG